MIDPKKNEVVTKGMQVKDAVKEKKTCPMCLRTTEFAGSIRCGICNKLMLSDKELQFQMEKLHQSERGKDDDLFERNEAKLKTRPKEE